MNVEFFISKKNLFEKKGKETFSRPVVKIAILGITLGTAVMLLTLAVVTGFQKEIREKIIGFGAHVQITYYDNNESYEWTPMAKNPEYLGQLSQHPAVRHVQIFAAKAGILKAQDEMQGVVVKGIGSDFDWNFFDDNIVAGSRFTVSDTAKTDKILISKFHAEKLKLKIRDTVIIYFVQDRQQRARKFSVSGIYETGLGDYFDEVFVLADIAHIQKLNGWDSLQVAGIEILLNDYSALEEVTEFANKIIGYEYIAKSIKELNRPVFSWLDAQDINAMVVIILMCLVAAINMVAALLVLILERTKMIGILKSLGMQNKSVQKIFLYQSFFLIGKGMLWGNVLGIALCWMQKYLRLISLDASTYYLSSVPIHINPLHFFLLNVGIMMVCMVFMLLPSYIVTFISPVKAMRFD